LSVLPIGAFPSPAVSLPGGAPAGNATAGNATSPANATAPAATFTTRGLRARLFQAVANDTAGAGANATANATAAAEFSRAGIRWTDLLFDGGVIHVSPRDKERRARGRALDSNSCKNETVSLGRIAVCIRHSDSL